MHSEKLTALDGSGASIEKNSPVLEPASAEGQYTVTCVGADGQVKWVEHIENTVVIVGKNDLLDKYFAGTTYTAAWYMGLVDAGSFSAVSTADTLASHAGWLEFLNYTISGSSTNRATPTWTAASAGAKATTATAFTISGAGGSVYGALMCTTQARNTASNGGAGILYSAGNFSGGTRAVIAGDTLNVTYTASV